MTGCFWHEAIALNNRFLCGCAFERAYFEDGLSAFQLDNPSPK
jgi:hypothetical protein